MPAIDWRFVLRSRHLRLCVMTVLQHNRPIPSHPLDSAHGCGGGVLLIRQLTMVVEDVLKALWVQQSQGAP